MTTIQQTETYRGYQISAAFECNADINESAFGQWAGLKLVDRFVAIVDGREIELIDACNCTDSAIAAAKHEVDSLLTHPLTGAALTRAERDELVGTLCGQNLSIA